MKKLLASIVIVLIISTFFLPQTQAAEHWIGGQRAWIHDPGFENGIFHTYDRLNQLPRLEDVV